MTAITSSSERGFLESWRALIRRRWRSGTVVFVLLFAFALAIVFLSRPVYRAEARLRIGEPPPSTGVSSGAGGIFGLRLGSDAFSNDLGLMSSRTLTEMLVDDARLAAIVKAPRGWHRDSLFTSFATSRDTEKATFAIEWLENGRVEVRRSAPTEAVLGQVVPGTPYTFGGVTATFRPWREDAPRNIQIRTLPFGEAVRVTRGKIRTERTRREANALDVRFDHTDPGIAKTAVTSIVDRFIELRTALHRKESVETVDSLRVVATETDDELRTIELEIQQAAQQNRLVAADTQSRSIIGRYNVALQQLETSRAELQGIEAAIARAARAEKPSDAWTALVSHPTFLAHGTMTDLLNRLTQLEVRRTELAPRRTNESLEYRMVNEQIAYLDGSLRSLVESYRVTLAETVRNLEQRVAGMDTLIVKVPGQTLQLARQQRSVRILSEFLAISEMRLRQEELRQALTFANIQIIDPPELRYRPVWPRKKVGTMVGFLLAGMSALLAMLIADRAGGRRVRRVTAAVLPSRDRDIAVILE